MSGRHFFCSKGLRLYRKVIQEGVLYYFLLVLQERMCNQLSVNNCLVREESVADVFWQRFFAEKFRLDHWWGRAG